MLVWYDYVVIYIVITVLQAQSTAFVSVDLP